MSGCTFGRSANGEIFHFQAGNDFSAGLWADKNERTHLVLRSASTSRLIAL